jgi:hypothetical protein
MPVPLLDSLSYCSRGDPDTDDTTVRQIVAVARRNNAIHGITGLLVHGAGVYFQWLEGPPQSINRLMQNIERDPRHRDVVILDRNLDEPERVFPQWEMEAVSPSEIEDVLADAVQSVQTSSNQASLQRLLHHVQALRDSTGR